MVDKEVNACILVVGDETSISKAGLLPDDGCEIEVVDSLAEAVAKQASGNYAKIIVDPAAINNSAFEILASPSSFNQAISQSETNFTTSPGPSTSADTITDIIESIRDNFFCLNREWRFTRINSEAERQFRKPCEELIGYNVWELFPEAVGTPYWTYYHKSMNERVPTQFEAYYPPHDIWTEVRVYPTTEGIAVYSLDISERKKVAEDLRRSRQLLQDIIDNTPAAIFVKDLDGRLIVANRALAEILDTVQEQIIGKTSFDFYPPEVAADHIANDREVVESGNVYVVEEIAPQDDGNRTFISQKFPLRTESGKIYGIAGVSTEITERKQAEEALRESENRYRLLHVTMVQGVVYQNADGSIISANPAALHIQGLAAEEFLGQTSVTRQSCCVREDGSEFPGNEHPSMVALRTGREVRDVVMGVYNPREERLRWININAVPLFRNGEEKPYQVYTIFDDITERKQVETELKGHRDLLATATANTKALLAYMDPDFNFIWVNSEYAKADNRSQEEFVGLNHFDLYPNEENQAIFEMVRDTGEPYEIAEKPFEYAEHSEKGASYWNWTLNAVKDDNGAVQGLVMSLLDVTQNVLTRQEIAAAYVQSETKAAQLESFYSSIAEGVALFDADANILSINDAGRQIVGLAPGEIPENWFGDYRRYTMDGDLIEPEQLPVMRSIRNGEVCRDVRMRMLLKDGAESIYSVSSSPVLNQHGDIIGAVSVFRDATSQVAFEQRQQEILEREHHIAQVLQQAIIPPTVPSEILGYKIAVTYRPALREAEIGGDFYDVFELADNKLGILIGDVAGKGLQAALRVASARHAIRSYAYVDPRPGRVMTFANEALCRDSGDVSQILTAFFAVLDPEGGVFTYSSAGHEPPVVCCGCDDCEELNAAGLPLGLMSGVQYGQSTRRLDPGNLVVMVTDGITEARAPGPELFGKERLVDYILSRFSASPEEIASGILDAATAHAGGELQDDAAVVVFTPLLPASLPQ